MMKQYSLCPTSWGGGREQTRDKPDRVIIRRLYRRRVFIALAVERDSVMYDARGRLGRNVLARVLPPCRRDIQVASTLRRPPHGELERKPAFDRASEMAKLKNHRRIALRDHPTGFGFGFVNSK